MMGRFEESYEQEWLKNRDYNIVVPDDLTDRELDDLVRAKSGPVRTYKLEAVLYDNPKAQVP